MDRYKDSLDGLNRDLSLSEKLRAIHTVLKEQHGIIDRIAVVVYDPKSDLLKTFIHSSGEDDPLSRYQVKLADAGSLRAILIDLKRLERIASARAGLGVHAVTYGPKEKCDNDPASPCYFAYVTHTFENYISVYDLESIEEAVKTNRPESGHFLINGKKSALTLSCKECIEGIHVGDIPLTLTKGHPPKRAFLHHRHLGIDLAAGAETGGQELLVIKPLLPPWGPVPIK